MITPYEKLDKLFRRFSIHKTEMVRDIYTVCGVIYFGMGDFLEFKGAGKDLETAVNSVINKYVDYFKICYYDGCSII
jgi:hypothetical protein